jgi:6-pyruvoyl-tetrahydropterin synthase
MDNQRAQDFRLINFDPSALTSIYQHPFAKNNARTIVDRIAEMLSQDTDALNARVELRAHIES